MSMRYQKSITNIQPSIKIADLCHLRPALSSFLAYTLPFFFAPKRQQRIFVDFGGSPVTFLVPFKFLLSVKVTKLLIFAFTAMVSQTYRETQS
jgi:hypothetical protein